MSEARVLFRLQTQWLNNGDKIMTLMQLAMRRQSLLEAAYRGAVDLAAWQALITDYLTIGAAYNAAWCVRKVRELSC